MPGFLDGGEELLVTDRLEEKVEGIDLVTVVGVLLEGRREDDLGLRRYLAREVKPIEIGHLDVEEKQIDSQRVERLEGSHGIIERTKEFVINLTTKDLAFATDWCGVKSGRDYKKFEEMGLTPARASVVNAPIVEEAPVAIECRVREIVPLGSHDMFVAEVVNVLADDRYLDPETGVFDLAKAEPLVYLHGGYYGLGEKIGKFGWSVEKKKSTR